MSRLLDNLPIHIGWVFVLSGWVFVVLSIVAVNILVWGGLLYLALRLIRAVEN